VLEEFVFRAVMLRTWLQTRTVWLSVLFSSLAFGAIHNTGFFFAASAGAMFAVLYLSYGSIWPAVLVHALHNLIASIPAVRERAFLRNLSEVDKWSSWSVELVLAVLFFPLAIWLIRRLLRSPAIQETLAQNRPGISS
jgi:membrane protease YdiL (CAAX protease family)